ncbi:polysaccharide deacetylase family protein [Thermus thermophilus]|uniref:polysaccharide deacetylase family protein n=1 Tax=Thermus thermophilus TaxID=274 RepID=UPI001FCC8D0A|nr:polysaccharide deacetylase family protein [Thermus thermophilus]BDG25332.1 polysaccharide deacetylase familiy protein [Thermus thermophilus]
MLGWLLALAPLPYVEGPGPSRPWPQEPLPALHLPLPEVVRAVYLGNGHLEAAHVVLQVPKDTPPSGLLRLAQEAAGLAFKARPSLDEVDLSLYPSPYQGPAGFPLFTASVPREKAQAFLELKAPTGYDRLWVNPGRNPPRPPDPVLEDRPRLEGPEAFRAKEKAEQVLASRLGYRGGVIYHGNPRQPYAALTFDDAPHPLFTPLLLDTLRRLGLKATFFVIGRNAEAYPYFVRDLVAQGHELGNHTYHHVRLPGLPEEVVREEILACNEVLLRLTGKSPRYFRPPGGRYDRTVLRVARELGLTTVFWTDDPGDYAGLAPGVLEARLQAHLRPGGIVLLHDNVRATLEVLPAFARLAEKRGLTLGPLSSLPLARR